MDSSDTDTVDRALLLATLPTLDTPHFLAPIIASATTHTRHRLLIVLFSPRFNHTAQWNDVLRLLTFAYVQATKVATHMDNILMDISVLLRSFHDDLPPDLAADMDVVFRVDGDAIAVPFPPSINSLRQRYLHPGGHSAPPQLDTPITTPSLFPVVALGGTFDHLHAGHKILLSMGAWIATQKLIVGVTDDTLLQNKSNKHILEPLPTRIHRARAFLQLFKPQIHHDLVPITDVYGPTGWDPNIQALVVSKETLSGAASIASHRASHALPPLQPFIIDVISATDPNLEQDPADADFLRRMKMSSTYIRAWIVEQNKEEEEEEPEPETDGVRVDGKV